jgi:ABC-type phosphate transport system auxiliary subunit
MTAKRITELRVWLTAALVVFALLAVVGFFIVLGMFTGEYWCEDRHPWWGPPESGTDAECAGYAYEQRHPRSP